MIATAQHFPLAEGDAGTAFTISKMAELVDDGKGSAAIRAQALKILNQHHVRAFDPEAAARAIYSWVLANITFTPDPVGKEGVQTAEWTLEYRRGDCDCISVLMCSLLESIGIRCRFITVASDPRNPDVFSHVYPEAFIGKWVSVDAARRHPAFGRSPSRFFRKRGWSVHDAVYQDFAPTEQQPMNGLGIMPASMPIPVAARRAGIPLYYMPPPPRLPAAARIRRRSLRGLGQDWSAIGEAIQAGAAGAANIITATRASPYNLFPTTYAPIGTAPAPTILRQPSAMPMTAGFLGVPSWVWVVGLGVAAVAALRR